MSAAHGRLCQFGNLENFCYLYVTIEGSVSPKRHVQLYSPEQERCSPTDAMPDIDAITIIKRSPDLIIGRSFRNHYETPAVRCGNEPRRLNPVTTRPKEAMLNGLRPLYNDG